MPVRATLAALAMVALTTVAAPPAAVADTDGPTGSTLLDGTWLFRRDTADVGVRQRWQRSRSTAGWTPVSVPNAWNAGDASQASFRGGVGWYRKDFTLPSSDPGLDWAVRFDSVNYRARVWLNGRQIGTNTGAYLPFELPLSRLSRRATNRLVVRVDSRRKPTDFPPGTGGGWWNWSGILRDVHLQKVDTLAISDVLVRPVPRSHGSAATVQVRVNLDNVSDHSQRATVSGRFGGHRFALKARTLKAGKTGAVSGSFRIRHPKLWSPPHPNLYPVRLTVRAGGRAVGGYALHSGVRSIKVVEGRLILNGQPLSFRGVGLHEEVKGKGFALNDADRRRLVAEARAIGATVLRVHYPYSEAIHELADELGLLIWEEIPVYQVHTKYMDDPAVQASAVDMLRRDIVANQNHPSVMLWSIANELSAYPDPGQRAYIADSARLAHSLDPTRPVALVVAGYPAALCQARAYEPLDVIGLNDYFGWYPGPSGQIFDRQNLSGYLNAVRRCYRRKALVVSEFGAEANRSGPIEEKGTFAFQQDFVDYQLGVFAGKPWLSGAIYWALTDFWVKPNWRGGDPRPSPPLFQKGLVTQDWVRKPAWRDVRAWFTRAPQL